MNRDFPRLLVATEFPPNALGGGPAVVRQMLKDWPTEKLLWWSCLPEQRPFAFQVQTHCVARIPRKIYPHSNLIRPKVWILRNVWSKWATKHLQSTIQKHQPDVIWTIPHQWSILPLANVLPTGQPRYHISVHDYPAHHAEEKIGLKMTNRLISQLDYLYKRAASRDAICQEMAADLEQRTGRSSDHIFNAGVEPEDFAFLEQKRSGVSNTIRIAHAGTITAEETFIRFVESLGRVRKDLPHPVELHLFGAHMYRGRRWFDAAWMIEHGNVPTERFKSELEKCNWGVSPMEFSSDNPRYNRFSLPSKTVRYLAAGLAVISLGHRDSTVVHLAKRYSFGVNIEDSDPTNIDGLLIRALSEQDVWLRYRDEILRCARAEFDAASMRTRLYASLRA